jgi:Galactose oxidase, central domain
VKVAALALVLLSAPLAAGAPAGLAPTGRMTEARSVHTATLLPDGRVLIVGGLGAESTAELYDPAGGRFTEAAPPLTPRVGHTATMLLDGRVLIADGWTAKAVGCSRARSCTTRRPCASRRPAR